MSSYVYTCSCSCVYYTWWHLDLPDVYTWTIEHLDVTYDEHLDVTYDEHLDVTYDVDLPDVYTWTIHMMTSS